MTQCRKKGHFWYYFLWISIGNIRGLLAYTMESKIKSISVKQPVNKGVASFTKTNFWNNTVHYCCVDVNVESNTYFSTKFMFWWWKKTPYWIWIYLFCLHEISWSLHLCSTCSTDLRSEPPKSSFCKLRLSDFSRLSSNKSRLSSSTASWK